MRTSVSSLRHSAIPCLLLFALSGCVAVPLAQMAVTQMAPAKAPCVTPSGCQSGNSFSDISKGISASFGKLAGGAAADQPVATDPSRR
jgi:hypothetical protein